MYAEPRSRRITRTGTVRLVAGAGLITMVLLGTPLALLAGAVGVGFGVRGQLAARRARRDLQAFSDATHERETRLTKAMQRRDDDRDFVLTALAHELRTPVTVVHGLLQLRAGSGSPLDPSTAYRVDHTLLRQSQRLVRLIADLSDVSALVMSAPGEPRPAAVHNLVEDALARVGERHDVSSVEVSCEPGLVVEVDARPVVLCVSHLVANAVLHGGPPITVTATATTDALTVTVADRGPGLPPGVDVFAPLSWGRHDSPSPGLGVGLAVVSRRIGAMGGLVSAETRPAFDGTELTLVIPVAGVRVRPVDGVVHEPESTARADSVS